ncbi:MAG TPA: DsbA family protein [Puia sp.]|jgi:2-polyprenyl-6-methoxyphenol hydroxylase-like FAD-dependent oxidoreductase/predicted DsbA family dithiol-disulfide isomerase|nr:DsbA family protein [Puia sp.]
MKIVIIGGGIAGVTIGIYFQKKGIEVNISERQADMNERGHAFLMHDDALSILRELNEGKADLPGQPVDRFLLQRPNGAEVKNVELDSMRCIKRCELIAFLQSMLQPQTITRGRTFSHFMRKDGKAVGAVFANGEIEYGDLFIGADGGNSKVREQLFGKVALTPVAVKEIVGISRNQAIAQRYARRFVKFQEIDRGLAFGMIPTSDNEFVWFMQYDPAIADVAPDKPEKIRAFCNRMLRGFPEVTGEILGSTDFTGTYIWSTKDFDLLPAFHQQNVVLLGDAAHLTLPFTSAGTTNAIVGAKALLQCLEDTDNYETAFREYYRQRAPVIEKHIFLGRQLKKIFLFPSGREESPLPFLASGRSAVCSRPAPPQEKRPAPAAPREKLLRVRYFTDPICSTCWIIQPAWKKLNLEYGHYLDIQYIMGGLLPSWKDCKGKIISPSDAAVHWKEVGESYKMPIDSDVWIEDPLSSSWPPSIGFKAAQFQDEHKAQLFLRRIREMIFLEKKNIMKWRFLETAALESGLDTDQFRKDYVGAARASFDSDLELAREMDVSSFPTLFFSDKAGNTIKLKGYQHYQDFENVILQLLPFAKKAEIDRQPESLFRYFPSMVDAEFALLSNLVRKDARKLLQELNQQGYIEKVESGNGILWKTKY